MKKVEIITTPNCASCATVKKMLDEMGVKYDVIDVVENPKILEKYQVMTAPGIAIDGKLKFSGVPTRKELENELK